MAARYFGKDIGAQYTTITEGSSTTSKGMEVVVANSTATGMSKEQLVLFLEEVIDYILNPSAAAAATAQDPPK